MLRGGLLRLLLAFLFSISAPLAFAATPTYSTYLSNAVTTSPANPTGNATSTPTMMGLGANCHLTPLFTGSIFFIISGVVQNNTGGDGYTLQLRYGTGTAPANAAAVTGSANGAAQSSTSVKAANVAEAFVQQWLAVGFTVGTAVWFDISLANQTGGTASLANITCSAIEF